MENNSKTIKEVAVLAGISVRTLHYYDKIGLLKPSGIALNGYRQYNDDCIRKLQQVMFFKELGIELKQIKQIINDEAYDERKVLKNHKELLKLKRDRLENLIELVDKTLCGEKVSLKEFDMTEIEKMKQIYAKEAEQKWGNTAAYKQYKSKTLKYSKSDWQRIEQQQSDIFKKFADCMKGVKDCEKTYGIVKEWQQHISKYYYECTDEILLGLAEMYVMDDRFKKNLDKHAKGLAQFISNSIKTVLKN